MDLTRETLAELERLLTEALPTLPWVEDSGDDEAYCSISGILSQSEQQRIDSDTNPHRGDFPSNANWIVVSPGCEPVQVDERFFTLITLAINSIPALIAAANSADVLTQKLIDINTALIGAQGEVARAIREILER